MNAMIIEKDRRAAWSGKRSLWCKSPWRSPFRFLHHQAHSFRFEQ